MEATEEVKVEKQEEKKEEGKSIQRSKTISGWYYHFKDTYGLSVCALLVFVYFNMGFRILMNLTMKDLFKVYLELEPVESQYFISLIALPWVLKVFIGIFVDNFKLFGTSRNIYLKISGLIMCGSLFCLQIPIFSGKYWALFLLMLFNLFNAIADVVTDAIMVIYARRDPEHGSSDLQTLHIISLSIGGITGSVVASYANEYFHPYYVFSFYACISVFHTILAYIIEEICVEEGVEMWDNIAVSLNHLKKPIVFGTIIFIIISRGIIPSYASIMYYYLLTVLNFSKQTIALLDLIAFCTAIIGSVVYNLVLKEIEFRKIMIIAHILIGISVIPTYMLVTRFSYEVLGINDVLFSFFSNAALEVLFVAFVFMPTLVVQIKIVPKNVEATIYNLFSTFKNMAHDFISPMIGGVIANEFEVSSYNFDNLKWIILIQFVVSFIPIFFVWMLPSNKDIEVFLESVHQEEREQKALLENNPNTKSEFTGSNA